MSVPHERPAAHAVVTGLIWLLGCQAVGEVAVRVTGIPVPGPVVGMVVLFVALQLRRPHHLAGVFVVSDALLHHLQLLFVPAGVGVVVHLALLRDEAWPVLLGLVGSWLVGLVVVAYVVTLLTRVRRPRSAS